MAPGLPAEGDTKGARGNTIHAVVNALGTVAKTPVFDQAVWLAEVTYAHWTSVTSGANLFNAVGYAPCLANGTSRTAISTRGWLRHPGLRRHRRRLHADLVPVLPGATCRHRSPTRSASTATRRRVRRQPGPGQLHRRPLGRLQISHLDIDFVGHTRDNGTSVTSQNGLTAFLKDRGFVSLTFRTTF